MAHQNIQFIKILDAKINQGKTKTFVHNKSLYIQHLIKIPHYPVPRVLVIHTSLNKNPTLPRP